MKGKRFFFVVTMWWMILLAMTGAIILCFHSDKERVSARENRVLQNMPAFTPGSFFGGEYSAEFESFLSDSVPGRSVLIDVSQGMLDSLSVNTAEDLYYLDTSAEEAANFTMEETSPSDAQDVPADTEQPAAAQDNGEPVSEDDAIFEMVGKDGENTLVYTYRRENLERIAANLEKFADVIPEDGNVFFTSIPFPGMAKRLTDHLGKYSGWRSTLCGKLDGMTSEKIKCFSAEEILEPHLVAGENLYLVNDHQWNDRGAYYVFEAMISAQGLTPTPFDEYQYQVNTDCEDTYNLLYPLAPAVNYRLTKIDNMDEIAFMNYYIPSTLSYLRGDVRPWHTVKTGFRTGRSALVVGDCYSYAFMPFLLPYYDEINACDMRDTFFSREKLGTSVADMIERRGIDDVYFIYSEANSANSATLLYYIGENLY